MAEAYIIELFSRKNEDEYISPEDADEVCILKRDDDTSLELSKEEMLAVVNIYNEKWKR